MYECNLMADKEEKGKDAFIFCEELIFYFSFFGLRYFAIRYFDKKVDFNKESKLLSF